MFGCEEHIQNGFTFFTVMQTLGLTEFCQYLLLSLMPIFHGFAQSLKFWKTLLQAQNEPAAQSCQDELGAERALMAYLLLRQGISAPQQGMSIPHVSPHGLDAESLECMDGAEMTFSRRVFPQEGQTSGLSSPPDDRYSKISLHELQRNS